MAHTDEGNEPYCSHCGYQLTGLTESSKCPECGRPVVDVLTRPSWGRKLARRYRSDTTVFGLPLVHIATGPRGDQRRGQAKGIIAIGDMATGVIAIGCVARGVIAIGFITMGLVGFGAFGIGLMAGLGGVAVGGIASGGVAIGIVAQGGCAVGVLADGVAAYGYVVRGKETVRGCYTVTPKGSSPGADQMLASWTWLIGGGRLGLWWLTTAAVVLLASAMIVLAGYGAGDAGEAVDSKPPR